MLILILMVVFLCFLAIWREQWRILGGVRELTEVVTGHGYHLSDRHLNDWRQLTNERASAVVYCGPDEAPYRAGDYVQHNDVVYRITMAALRERNAEGHYIILLRALVVARPVESHADVV